jgi:transcriptional regulator with XRE-family HTH domain
MKKRRQTTPTDPTVGYRGCAHLAAWIDRRQVNQVEAARIIGIDVTQLSQILNGHRRPGLDNAVLIERATGVVVEDWVPSDVGRSTAA